MANSTDDFSVATTLQSQAEKIDKCFKMILKMGKKVEAIDKEAKESKTVKLTPMPSAGPSSKTSSTALSLTQSVQVETLSKEIEIVKTKLAEISLNGGRTFDLNSDNVAKWIERKFDAFLQAPPARNKIREIVTAKLDSYQVRDTS